MTITYGSVCSGIEAASVAWECLGWQPAWFSQFDPEHDYSRGPDFPSAVLDYHWPEVPNLGDMTKIAAAVSAGTTPAPDIIVGGTPCQDFSVAGARAGLSGSRGQLTISYGELADAVDDRRATEGKEPAIFVWENVPGVLSSKDNAFGAFLGLLAGEDCRLQPPGKRWANAGYVRGPKRAIAWRILDAQYFGVAQRRRRVFVIASARRDINPAKILFESDGMRRDIAPGRGKKEEVAGTLKARANSGGWSQDVDMAAGGYMQVVRSGIIGAYRTFGEYADDETASTVKARDHKDATDLTVTYSDISRTLLAKPYGSMAEDLDTYAIHGTQDPGILSEMAHTLGRNHGQENAVIAFSSKDNGQDATCELSPTMRAGNSASSNQNAGQPPAVVIARTVSLGDDEKPHALHQMAVRRLTPIECERLQGFPDNYTMIPVNARKQITAEEYTYQRHHNPALTAEEAYRLAKDGPRYKALGNSMAVPVMRWIGQRIANAVRDADARTA
jgi:DNA (cytosine-5)-methyltransferase 1